MRLILIAALVCVVTSVCPAELSEKTQKKLDNAEAAYKSATDKADNARFYAIQKANADRLKVLKQVLTEATKSGDFDGATQIKDLIAAAEAGSIRSKPKNVQKFGGHEYAAFIDAVSFYNAKRRCEEMGGHLATMETPQEQEFILALCRSPKERFGCWIGATNEDKQDRWMWITGTPATQASTWKHDNPNFQNIGHGMTYWPDSDGFNDDNLGTRMGYVCEWEK